MVVTFNDIAIGNKRLNASRRDVFASGQIKLQPILYADAVAGLSGVVSRRFYSSKRFVKLSVCWPMDLVEIAVISGYRDYGVSLEQRRLLPAILVRQV
jgi:hypothetical protein